MPFSEPNSSAVNSKYDDIQLETICEPRVWVYLVAFIMLISLTICLFSFCLALTYYALKTCKYCVIMLLYSLPYLCIGALISSLLGICFHAVNSYNLSYEYNFIPNNNHLVPFSNVYCRSLSLNVAYNHSNDHMVSLHKLSAKPITYDQKPLTISEEISAEVRHYYLLYLNNGSTIFINACFVNGSAITSKTNMYIAKGIDGYNGGHKQSDIKALHSKLIDNDCNSFDTPYKFLVNEDNFYYIIFFTSTRGYIPQLHMRVTMTFHLIQYSLENIIITSNCSVSTFSKESKCSIGISLLHTDYVLLSTDSNSFDENSLESIPIEIQCSPRLWIFIFPPTLLLLFVIPITCCVNRKICFKNNRKTAPGCNWFCLHYAYIKMATPDQTDAITAKFERAWTKGRVGEVTAVFVVHNRWHQFVCWFRSGREEYYHGTSTGPKARVYKGSLQIVNL